MADRLRKYRSMRDPGHTPEPVPEPGGDQTPGDGRIFVIQQHHARRLHWDFRLERDGVLVSWAIPRGVPRDPGRDHLAVHTEDHPMEYAEFAGEIPAGEYGAGKVLLHDRGRYTTEKWLDDEVMVVLHGERTSGRYVLFRTRGDDWMIHRMDPPDPGWQPLPDLVRPMWPTRGRLPADPSGWGFEMRWDGLRAVGYVSGGRLRLLDGDDVDVTARYPDLRGLAEDLAPAECVVDGEIVGFTGGRIDPQPAHDRHQVTDPGRARRVAEREPVSYLIYDLLHLDGSATVDLTYRQRRSRLEDLDIAGDRWLVPPHFPGTGDAALRTAREQGLPGVVGKRLDSPYRSGRRGRDWLSITAVRSR
ncbi:MAG TPA: DNA polymerase ligase N-terminal domain-containing protein [Micromonosporaceae bacterium]